MLSVPLLRKSGVGGGAASWSEENGLRWLEFRGYSLPERAAGLNRVGLIRELSRQEGERSESIYFGLMTSSPEESIGEAREALRRRDPRVTCSAIEGRISPDGVEAASAHFQAPAQLSDGPGEPLTEMARQALSGADFRAAEFDPRLACGGSFLQEIAGLLRDGGRSETRDVYGGASVPAVVPPFARCEGVRVFPGEEADRGRRRRDANRRQTAARGRRRGDGLSALGGRGGRAADSGADRGPGEAVFAAYVRGGMETRLEGRGEV